VLLAIGEWSEYPGPGGRSVVGRTYRKQSETSQRRKRASPEEAIDVARLIRQTDPPGHQRGVQGVQGVQRFESGDDRSLHEGRQEVTVSRESGFGSCDSGRMATVISVWSPSQSLYI
jgi:hypothetical protein